MTPSTASFFISRYSFAPEYHRRLQQYPSIPQWDERASVRNDNGTCGGSSMWRRDYAKGVYNLLSIAERYSWSP